MSRVDPRFYELDADTGTFTQAAQAEWEQAEREDFEELRRNDPERFEEYLRGPSPDQLAEWERWDDKELSTRELRRER